MSKFERDRYSNYHSLVLPFSLPSPSWKFENFSPLEFRNYLLVQIPIQSSILKKNLFASKNIRVSKYSIYPKETWSQKDVQTRSILELSSSPFSFLPSQLRNSKILLHSKFQTISSYNLLQFLKIISSRVKNINVSNYQKKCDVKIRIFSKRRRHVFRWNNWPQFDRVIRASHLGCASSTRFHQLGQE